MLPRITLRSNLAGEFEVYAREAGITLESAVNDALNEWMNETGRDICAELIKRRKANTAAPITAGRSLRLVKGNSAIAS